MCKLRLEDAKQGKQDLSCCYIWVFLTGLNDFNKKYLKLICCKLYINQKLWNSDNYRFVRETNIKLLINKQVK